MPVEIAGRSFGWFYFGAIGAMKLLWEGVLYRSRYKIPNAFVIHSVDRSYRGAEKPVWFQVSCLSLE